MFWTKSSIGCTIALHQLWIFPNLFFNLCLFRPVLFLKGNANAPQQKQQPTTHNHQPKFSSSRSPKIPPQKNKQTAIPKNPQVVYLHLCRGAGIAINSPCSP